MDPETYLRLRRECGIRRGWFKVRCRQCQGRGSYYYIPRVTRRMLCLWTAPDEPLEPPQPQERTCELCHGKGWIPRLRPGTITVPVDQGGDTALLLYRFHHFQRAMQRFVMQHGGQRALFTFDPRGGDAYDAPPVTPTPAETRGLNQ